MSHSTQSHVFVNTLDNTVSRLPLPAVWTAGSKQQRTLIMGVALAILSNLLFGVLYAYSSFFSAVIWHPSFYLADVGNVGSANRLSCD